MDGILNINKPQGLSSYGVVARVKRLTGEQRVGHAGTLDPLASGVLPVCLGRGTRVIQFLYQAHKVYRAQIRLGLATDTYDAAGRVIQRGNPSSVSRRKLESALEPFRGLIRQVPPMYSAVKHKGKRLYELARAGITVERKSRLAEIYSLELLEFKSPVITIEVECGKGTYIRSLAHDLGQSLGCGAHLESLVRLRYGNFDINDAVSLPQFEADCHLDCWRHFVYSLDTALLQWPVIVVGEDSERFVTNGRPLPLNAGELPKESSFSRFLRVYGQDGRFLAMMRFRADSGRWHPVKVFVD